MLRRFALHASGATAIEYSLYAMGVSLVILPAVQQIGTKSNTTYTTIADALGRSTETAGQTIEGTSASETLTGSAGNDTIFGRGGNDTISGGAGDDRIVTGNGDSSVNAGDGNDTVTMGFGNQTLEGGSGSDTLDLSDFGQNGDYAYVDIDLSSNYAYTENDDGGYNSSLDGFENVTGSNAGDNIRGDNNANVISGLGGTDSLYGLGGNDTLLGGDDDDYLDGGAGADILNGGNGNDSATYSDSLSGVSINLKTGIATGGDAQGDTLTSIENLAGSNYNDIFIGDDSANFLQGGAGNDRLTGGLGDDVVVGDTGNDVFVFDGITPQGNDQVGDYSGVILGARQDIDTIQFTNSSLTIGQISYSWNGSNRVLTYPGGTISIIGAKNSPYYMIQRIQLADGSYHDIDYYIAPQTYNGTSGADTINGDGGDDTINGLDGNDVLQGGYGNDTVNGGNGNDTINGEYGNDTLNGGAGNDLFGADAGADIIDGGADYDTVGFQSSPTGVNVNLSTGINTGGYAQGDTYTNIENFYGSPYNDTITCGTAACYFYDFLGGNNTFNGSPAADSVTFTANGTNTFNGYDGDDLVTAGPGTEILSGGNGSDMLYYWNSNAAVNINLATNTVSGGHAQGDTISGFESVTGSNYDDTLTGTSGNNSLFSGNGNDTLNGGTGNDSLIGGSGNDTYIFDGAINEGTDGISEQAAGASTDIIRFTNMSVTAANITLSWSGTTRVVTYPGGVINIAGALNTPINQVETIQFANGTSMTITY